MKETEIIDLVPSSISQNLPAMVKNELAKLSAQKQEEFMGGFFIWFLIDLFRIPRLIRDYNKDQAVDILRNLKAISTS